MDWLTKFLAKLIDSFKLGNPKSYTFIAFVVGVLGYVINNGVEMGLFEQTTTISKLLEILAWVTAILIGSRTTSFIKKDQDSIQANAMKQKIPS